MIYRLLPMLVAFCLIFVHSLSFASEKATFYVVNYPPHIIVDDDGSVSGMDIDIVKAAFQTQNIEVAFKVLPWKRIVKLMQNGEILGTMSCSKRESRMNYMIFGDVISSLRPGVVTRKGFDTSDIHILSDLNNYRVVSVLGWGVETQLTKKGIQHRTTPDIRTALVNITYRDIDVFYNTIGPSLARAKQMEIAQDLKVIYLDDVPHVDLHLCFSRQYTESQPLLEIFNKGLKQIKEEGIYDSIRNNFI